MRDYSRASTAGSPRSFLVDADEVARGRGALPDELREHIAFAQAQVRGFAERQRATLADLEVETLPRRRARPPARAGRTPSAPTCPAGATRCSPPSFMTVVVPKVAGVERVVACAPPRDGAGIHPAMLHAMRRSGADQIVCLGGVQALAAMAFGLGGVEPVDMIVGAGNAYVAEAKRQLFGRVGIDLLAGPTEILVIADDTADAELVAADLLGQAEHGPTSPAVLITTSRRARRGVVGRVERAARATGRPRDVAGAAWRDHGEVVVARDRDEAIALADGYAPEHLEVQVARRRARRLPRRPAQLRLALPRRRRRPSPTATRRSAPTTCCPRRGAARYTGGLWVGKFLKTVTYQRLTEEGTRARRARRGRDLARRGVRRARADRRACGWSGRGR